MLEDLIPSSNLLALPDRKEEREGGRKKRGGTGPQGVKELSMQAAT